MKTVTVKEETLRDLSRFADPAITFRGSLVHVEMTQEMFDAEGNPTGIATVKFQGMRRFGRKVEFETPLKVTVLGAPVDEVAHFEQAAHFALEAFQDVDSGKK